MIAKQSRIFWQKATTPIIVSFMLSSFSVSVALITTNVGTLMTFGEG
jgi:hypothetical protein